MQPTTYQQPELRDANDQIIRRGTFGKNTALSNSTNDGWIDYVMNNLEYLHDNCLPLSGGTMTGGIISKNGANLGNSNQRWGTLYAQKVDSGTYVFGAFNKKTRLTTSGTYIAPVTGTYRITLQGGGGGGAGSSNITNTGGGGSSGRTEVFYYGLTKNNSYPYVIGAGGAGGAGVRDGAARGTGKNGGDTTFNTVLTALGGIGGSDAAGGSRQLVYVGGKGSPIINSQAAYGGFGGGYGGGQANVSTAGGTSFKANDGIYGGGGGGGSYVNGAACDGGNGGNGYIDIEYYEPY